MSWHRPTNQWPVQRQRPGEEKYGPDSLPDFSEFGALTRGRARSSGPSPSDV